MHTLDRRNSQLTGSEQTKVHVNESKASTDNKRNQFTEDVCSFVGYRKGQCTIAIIPVHVRSKNGLKTVDTYAFLDPGSSVTFCSGDLMHRFGAGGKTAKITVNIMSKPETVLTHIIKDLDITETEILNSKYWF